MNVSIMGIVCLVRCEQVLRQHPGDDWLQTLYMVEAVLGGVHPSHRWRKSTDTAEHPKS